MRDIIFRGKRTDGRGWAYGAYVECRLSWYRRHPHRAWEKYLVGGEDHDSGGTAGHH